MTVLIFLFIRLALTMVLLFLTKVLSVVTEIDSQKWVAFECGFDSQTPSHNSFSIQFFFGYNFVFNL